MERMPKVKRWGGKDKQREKRETERDGLKMATKSGAIRLCRQHRVLSSHTVFFFCICVCIVFLDNESLGEKILGCRFLYPTWITFQSYPGYNPAILYYEQEAIYHDLFALSDRIAVYHAKVQLTVDFAVAG